MRERREPEKDQNSEVWEGKYNSCGTVLVQAGYFYRLCLLKDEMSS
jgi:hypothetical protein